jgi:hypothetical protein
VRAASDPEVHAVFSWFASFSKHAPPAFASALASSTSSCCVLDTRGDNIKITSTVKLNLSAIRSNSQAALSGCDADRNSGTLDPTPRKNNNPMLCFHRSFSAN